MIYGPRSGSVGWAKAWGAERGKGRKGEREKGRKGALPCSPALLDDGAVGGVSAGAAECGGGGHWRLMSPDDAGDPGDGVDLGEDDTG